MNDVAGKIAERIGRSLEAVREALKKYDLEHPEAAVFGEEGELVRGGERSGIVKLFEEGVPVDRIAERFARTKASIFRIVTEERAAELQGELSEVVGTRVGEHPEAGGIGMTELAAEALARRRRRWRRGRTGSWGMCIWCGCRGICRGFCRIFLTSP